ncbi:hypothetical protein TcasGA2_TC013674 [Tribolium castaneum]|uniref:Uncharacterized protein n=1 Tax=Tribolium castaneum TaxID=7070 RepID=D6WKE5_TRICA|nr:hypothetical protein TcasGA2_TC013674 [Tribolium castaneum]
MAICSTLGRRFKILMTTDNNLVVLFESRSFKLIPVNLYPNANGAEEESFVRYRRFLSAKSGLNNVRAAVDNLMLYSVFNYWGRLLISGTGRCPNSEAPPPTPPILEITFIVRYFSPKVHQISWKPLIELVPTEHLMNVRNRNKQTMVITMIKCGVVNHAVIAGEIVTSSVMKTEMRQSTYSETILSILFRLLNKKLAGIEVVTIFVIKNWASERMIAKV